MSRNPNLPSPPAAGDSASTARRTDAIVLLSGGLDSTTVLAHTCHQGHRVAALSFTYGQRHDLELDAARRQARLWDVSEHIVVDIDLRPVGGSALTGNLPVPKDRPPERMATEIPPTYVPARNALFLTYALAMAEARAVCDIYIGINAVDYSGYPDCRPQFLRAFEEMARTATKAGSTGSSFRIHAPLMHKSKAEIIQLGHRLGVDYGQTWTCYDPTPEERPCTACDACRLRQKGFAAAGLADPLLCFP
jgi:7-cyano-7-deazaguanine synthase